MYLNVQRAAIRLGVAPHTVRRWTASGLLSCTRTPGGHRRFRQEDVDALAQQIGGSNHLAARRARERELDTLLETSLALVSRLDLPELLREIAERLTRLMDCHFCAISSYDEVSRTVAMLADYDDGGRRLPDTEEYPLARYPLTRRVIEGREPALVNVGDPAADPDELRDLAREGDKSILMVPLVYGGRAIGLVELIDHARERRYSRQELRICGAIAGQAAAALHNARLFADAGAAALDMAALGGRLEAMAAETAVLGAAGDVDSLLETVARAACRIFEASSCVVSARGRSAGWAGGGGSGSEAAVASFGGAAGRASGLPPVSVTGAEVLTAGDASGGGELRLTLSLPRASRGGEPQLLGMLAALAGAHLARLN